MIKSVRKNIAKNRYGILTENKPLPLSIQHFFTLGNKGKVLQCLAFLSHELIARNPFTPQAGPMIPGAEYTPQRPMLSRPQQLSDSWLSGKTDERRSFLFVEHSVALICKLVPFPPRQIR